MTIAMVGLISFQIYWINSAIRVHEESFNQNVHEALNQVVNHLEKREVYYAATNSFNFNKFWNLQPNMDSMFFAQRSMNSNRPAHRINPIQNNTESWNAIVEFEDSFNIGNQHITVSYKINDRVVPDPNEILERNISETQQVDVDIQLDTFEWVHEEIQKNIEKVAERSQMVTIVLDELMNPNKTIQRRIPKKELESLMDEALNGKGINLDYEYLVYNNRDGNVYYSNYLNTHQRDLGESDITVSLYPNDIIGPQTLLTISFPDQFGFLLKQIWFTLSSSFFLVLLIIFSFSYAVMTIIRQKKLSEMKNDFINNMTHELKTPISTVSLACQALQDQEIARNENFLDKYVRVIDDENNRLGQQVEKVLQMARLEKKDFKLNMERLDIHEIIENAIENTKLLVEKRGGRITCDLHASRTNLNTDEVHMINILNNLLDNANKYSPEEPEINVRTENSGTGIKVIISDKGIGMSKESLKKIFDKFYRVSTGNLHDVKGFGLGLSYVKTMVQALGGEISVSSVPQKGSRFEIYFPQNNE